MFLNRKWDKIMKYVKCRYIRIALAVFLISLSGRFAQAQTLGSLHLSSLQENELKIEKGMDLERALEEVEQQFNVVFLYRTDTMKGKKVSSTKILPKDVKKALSDLLKGQGLSFKYLNPKTYGIYATEQPAEREKIRPVQEQVTGRVIDAQSGETLPGVNVMVKGTTTGTSTDSGGGFELTVESLQDTLIFTYIGYQRQEVPINGRNELDIQLTPEAIMGEEMIVVGYGEQRRGDLTGAISSLSNENINDQPVTTFEQSMAGKVAGVQVKQGTGAPGSSPSIRVRGTGSISADNEPLYVIDGFAQAGDLGNINPNDIESIDILKDASATAIYGSRGSNGVVLITTKQGTANEFQANAHVYAGFQEVSKKFDVLNAEQWVQFWTEARDNAYLDAGGDIDDPIESRPEQFQYPSEFSNAASFGEGTDWQDMIFRAAPVQNYNLSFAGGSDKLQYYISGNYLDQQGIIKNSGFKRYSLRANFDLNLTENIQFGVNINPSRSKENYVQAEGHWGSNGAILSALNQPPIFEPYKEDGSYNSLVSFGWGTPMIPSPLVPIYELDDFRYKSKIFGTSYAEIQLLDGLEFKTSFSTDVMNYENNTYRTSKAERNGGPAPQPPEATYSSEQNVNWLFENTLSYTKNFQRKHFIDAIVGYTVQKANFESGYLFATNFPNDQVRTLNAGQVTDGNSLASEWSLISYLSRINYAFDDKYLLTATIRRDGSSRFGQNTRWGIFPSASVGWRISQEEFMQDFSFISNLKVRASYGLTGNNSIPNYGAIGLLDIDRYVYGPGNDNVVSAVVPSTIPNEGLGWEKTEELNLGVDLGLFQDRVIVNAERYISNTTDLLLNVPVPSVTGYSSSLQNIGEVKNTGWEFTLTTRNLTNKFQWTSDFNISTNKNEVLALGPEGDPIRAGSKDSHITQIGSPIGSYYGYIFEGIYNTQEEINARPHLSTDAPGDPIIKDVNGDGEISADDRTIIGNPFPDFIYGITNTFNYKNFDLKVLIQGVQGHDIQLRDYTWLYLPEGKMNVSAALLNRWKSPEDPGNGKIPRADANTEGYRRQPSTLWVQDGSFLRIRNITMGYNLSDSILGNSLQSARIYFSIQNALTFTGFDGYNPEVSRTMNNPLTPGMQEGGYPVPRTYTLGLNISF